MDTTSQRPIMTISLTDGLIRMGKSIGIGAVSPLVWAIILAAAVSVLCSSITAFFVVSRLDGNRWMGWTSQIVLVKGKNRRVMIPLFMTVDDLRDLQEGK